MLIYIVLVRICPFKRSVLTGLQTIHHLASAARISKTHPRIYMIVAMTMMLLIMIVMVVLMLMVMVVKRMMITNPIFL